MVGLDSSVILREVWVASGHVSVFSDPLVMPELPQALAGRPTRGGVREPARVEEDAVALNEVPCPNCGNRGQYTEPRDFNMMLKTYLGPIEDESGLHYLRPETAQGIFVNFKNVLNATRQKPPFGVAQVGKSFRNEITPGNSSSAPRPEQMEMEFFVEPGTDEEWQRMIDARKDWYVGLGI